MEELSSYWPRRIRCSATHRLLLGFLVGAHGAGSENLITSEEKGFAYRFLELRARSWEELQDRLRSRAGIWIFQQKH